MLDAVFSEKDIARQMQAVENRVKRLEFEDKRAKKLSNIAEKRARDLILSRKKHFEEMEFKKLYNEEQHRQLLEMREKINKERRDRAESIRKQRFETLKKNLNYKCESQKEFESILTQAERDKKANMDRQKQMFKKHSSEDHETFDLKVKLMRNAESQNRANYMKRMEDTL